MYGPSKNSTFDMDNLQEAATGAGYVHFLKSNKQFDLVWIGSVVSLTGMLTLFMSSVLLSSFIMLSLHHLPVSPLHFPSYLF